MNETVIIAISGTPGVGKTTIANKLSNKLKCKCISITEFIKREEIYDDWDPKLETHIVDEIKLKNALNVYIDKLLRDEECLILEGLLADIIADIAEVAIVLRLHPIELHKRLEKRGYSSDKTRENVQSEILGTCTYHMKEVLGENFVDIDTTDKDSDEIIQILLDIIQGKEGARATHMPGKIDWLKDEQINLTDFF